MKLNGTEPEIHTLNPLPAKLPNTFCEPCAIKTAASASRSGTVTQLDEVLMIRLNIYPPFEIRSFRNIAEILVYLSQKVPHSIIGLHFHGARVFTSVWPQLKPPDYSYACFGLTIWTAWLEWSPIQT
jgi:hypothetical protein